MGLRGPGGLWRIHECEGVTVIQVKGTQNVEGVFCIQIWIGLCLAVWKKIMEKYILRLHLEWI